MLKLGHISYSNCVPVHGRFLETGPPESVTLVHGVPTELNRRLERGEIDVAPASSIEYARNSDRYRILPDLSISAHGPVQTIQLITREPLDALRDRSRLGLPSASATSVTLLKIIMRQRIGISPAFFWFDQELQDPFALGGDGALYIGDIARRHSCRPGTHAHDLAEFWRAWTGLPFVFALWQARASAERNGELAELAHALIASRDWSLERLPQLGARYAGEYGWAADDLVMYWRSLAYGWNSELEAGLGEFFARAAELRELETAPAVRFAEL